jgi:hypothetical protein
MHKQARKKAKDKQNMFTIIQQYEQSRGQRLINIQTAEEVR